LCNCMSFSRRSFSAAILLCASSLQRKNSSEGTFNSHENSSEGTFIPASHEHESVGTFRHFCNGRENGSEGTFIAATRTVTVCPSLQYLQKVNK